MGRGKSSREVSALKKHYTLDEIERAYREEHPDWTIEQVREAAQKLKRELRRLDSNWYYSNKQFYRHEAPSGLRPGEARGDA